LTHLVVDAGNTSIKAGLFSGNQLIAKTSFRGKSYSPLAEFLKIQAEQPTTGILSSVRKEDSSLPLSDFIQNLGISKLLEIRSGVRLPIKILYKTPETLGNDRLANACGAASIFPDKNILIIDTGTCIKYDVVRKDAVYPGGAISPGLRMRYKSLSMFTGKLPYFKPDDDEIELTGTSTEGSIRSGVENGIISEIDAMTDKFSEIYSDIKVVLTGGDSHRFINKLKKSGIFAEDDLTLKGLNVILNLNVTN